MIRWLTVFFLFFSFLIIFGSSKPQYDFEPIPTKLTRVSGEVHPEKAEENILGKNVKPIVLQPAAQPNFPAHSHMTFENKVEPVLPRPQTGIVPPPNATEESFLTLTSAELAKETIATDVGTSEKSASEANVTETVASKTSSAESDSTSEEKTKTGSETSGYDVASSNTETSEIVVAANITNAPIVESSSVLVEQTTSISATTSDVTTEAPKDSEFKKTTAPTVVNSEVSTIVDEKKEAQSTTTTVSEKNGTVEATLATSESGNVSIAANLTSEVPSEFIATSVQSYENVGSSDDKKPEESTTAVVEEDKNASVIVATPLTTSKVSSDLQTSKITTVSSTKASEITEETKIVPEQKVENNSDVESTTLSAAESSPQATIKTSTQPPSIESKTAPEVITSGYENAGIEPEPTPNTNSNDTKLVDSTSKASETSIKAETSNATTAPIIPPTEEVVNNSAAIPENQNLKTVAETQNAPKITSAASVVSENESTTTLASETATKTNETTFAPNVSENREISEAQIEGYEAAAVTGAPEASSFSSETPASKSSAIGPVTATSEASETATAANSVLGTTISSVESSYDSISLKEKTLVSITKEETTTIVATEILSTTAASDNQKNKTATSAALVASKVITSVPEAPSEGTTPLASILVETSTSAASTSEANAAAGYDNPVTQTSAKSETEAASKTLTVTNGNVASTNHDANLAQTSTPATSTSEAVGFDNPVTQTSAKSIEAASETSTLTNGSVAHTNQVVILAQTSTPATSTSEASETIGSDNSVIQTSAKSETKLFTDVATASVATSIHPQTQSSTINASSTIVESSTTSTKGSSNTSKHGKKSKTKHLESETVSRELVEPSGYSGNEPLSAEQIKHHPSNIVLPHDAVGYNGIEVMSKTSEQKDITVDSETKGVVEHLLIRKIDNSTKSKWKPFVMNCENEIDDKGKFLCKEWAKGGLCDKHKATMFLFCRKTCLCDGPPIVDDSSEEKLVQRNNLFGNRLRKFQFH